MSQSVFHVDWTNKILDSKVCNLVAKYLKIYVGGNWFCYIFVLQNKMGSLFNQRKSEQAILKMAVIDWCARHKW